MSFYFQVPGYLSRNDFVKVSSTNAAQLLNLYPRKGHIAVGSDADIVIWKQGEQQQITAHSEKLGVTKSGCSDAFKDVVVSQTPSVVVHNGKVVLQDDQVCYLIML